MKKKQMFFWNCLCFFDDPTDVGNLISNSSVFSMQPHRRQPTRLPHPWESPGKNTGVGCRFSDFIAEHFYPFTLSLNFLHALSPWQPLFYSVCMLDIFFLKISNRTDTMQYLSLSSLFHLS